MSTTQIDFVSDNNPEMFAYLLGKDMVPAYVQESSRVTQGECDALAKVAFADPVNRLFPCHTKVACWQSAAYFAGRNMSDSSVKEAIVKMAKIHGISDDVEKLFTEFGDVFTKAAAAREEANRPPMQKFAFVMDFQGAHGRGKEGFYPCNTADEVYGSAMQLNQDYNRGLMPINTMRKVACAIVEAAEETGLAFEELPAQVLRFGEPRLPAPQTAMELVSMRKAASSSVDLEAYNNVLQKLASDMANAATHSDGIALAEKAAADLVSLDKKAGVTYTRGQLDPYALIFSGPAVSDMYKAATMCITIGDTELPSVDFLNISDGTIDRIFSTREAGVIKAAKETLSGTPSIEKRSAAEEKLSTLSPNATIVLLNTAANTGW